jgi:hypothetical protein
MWLSPPRIQTQGCFSWAGARLHILMVVSSDADATMSGLPGEVARSLMPWSRSVTIPSPGCSPTYTTMTNKRLQSQLVLWTAILPKVDDLL